MPPSTRSRTSAASWLTVRMRGAGPGRSITRLPGSSLAARDERLEHLPALEELEGVIELRIRAELAFLDVRGDRLGRRLAGARAGGGRLRLPALLLAVLRLRSAEMARGIGLAEEGRGGLVGLREHRGLIHLDVGNDPRRLDRPPARRVVARRRQAEGRAVVERQDRLHGPLAERRRAEDQRALVVLERARDDLRGARAAAVHEHDHREVGPRPRLVREVLLLLVLEATVGVDDQARVEEQVRDLHRLGEETARIVAQVEDETLEAAGLLVELLQR